MIKFRLFVVQEVFEIFCVNQLLLNIWLKVDVIGLFVELMAQTPDFSFNDKSKVLSIKKELAVVSSEVRIELFDE